MVIFHCYVSSPEGNTCRHQALERDSPLIAPITVAIGTYRTMAAGENVLAEADDARLDCPGG